jgi:hypothetical protein
VSMCVYAVCGQQDPAVAAKVGRTYQTVITHLLVCSVSVQCAGVRAQVCGVRVQSAGVWCAYVRCVRKLSVPVPISSPPEN